MDAAVAPRFSAPTRRRQWTTVAFLIAAGVVNYMDRSTLAIANHTIAAEMQLSPSEMGALLSAFAWTYGFCQLPIGSVSDRLGPRIMLAAGMTLWSFAQIAAGAVQSFGQFLFARVWLGIGESPMFTAGARACVDWFPLTTRGLPLGLFNASSSLGPALAPPLLTGLMLAFGWRIMFALMGGAGLIVALVWWLYYRDPEALGVSSADRAAIRAGEITTEARPGLRTWSRLFGVPTTWALVGGLFGLVYVTLLNVAWLPDYLETERHVSIARTGFLAAIPQFAGFVGGCLGGWVSDLLAQRGADPIVVRRDLTVGGLVIASIFTAFAPLVPGTGLIIGLMSVSMFFGYGAGSTSWALGASLTPPHLVATLESIQNIGGSLGGALALFVTGVIDQYTGSFTPAFLLAGIAGVASAVCYLFVRRDAYEGMKG